jgi:glutamate--cysteine ligase
MGVRAADGSYQQLADSLLQIENEFYGVIRPKRVIDAGERPLHALRARGVQYVEVRLLDLNPFEPIGISAQTLRFLDVFLLLCLRSESPLDSPQEIAAMSRNQQRVAERGREPGLALERAGQSVPLLDWAQAIIQAMQPLAAQLDAVYGNADYSAAVQAAERALLQPQLLPSAQVLEAITGPFAGSFLDFTAAQSLKIKQQMLALAPDAAAQSLLRQQSQDSVLAQRQLEAADNVPFEAYLEAYLSPQRLLFSADGL